MVSLLITWWTDVVTSRFCYLDRLTYESDLADCKLRSQKPSFLQALPGQTTPEGVPSFKLVLVGDGGTGDYLGFFFVKFTYWRPGQVASRPL